MPVETVDCEVDEAGRLLFLDNGSPQNIPKKPK